MRRLILTFMTMVAMHSGAGALQPHQAPAAGGIGAYMRGVISQGPATGYSGGAAYTVVAFGESIPRPPSASVKYGW